VSTKPSPSPAAAADGADPVSRFESSLKELEDIVTRMERGDLPLEQSLQLFERGVTLTRECRGSLETAELRVRNLLEAQDDAKPEEPDDAEDDLV
jgi:exodeoxyribonuclease VII small subunit